MNSKWRSPLSVRARTSPITGLKIIETSGPNGKLKGGACCSCCSSISSTPLCAILGFRAAHLCSLSTSSSASEQQPQQNTPNPTPSLIEKTSIPLPQRAFSCDWFGGNNEKLLVGSTNGSIYCLSFESSSIISEFHPQKPPPPHQQPAFNEKPLPVLSVSSCPYDSSAFATTEGDTFHIWSCENQLPVLTRKPILNSTLSSFVWSPHTEAIAAISSSPHTLSFIDIRLDKPIISSKVNSHSQQPIALSWSPYIPYWIATGGRDSKINIWDLRNSSIPVLCLSNNNFGSINSIAWDSKHAELFAVGSSDASLSCCSLEIEPDRLLWKHTTKSSGGIISVGFSQTKTKQSLCYGVTSLGSVVIAEMDDNFFEPVIETRSFFKDNESRHVAKQVYLRQFKKAFSDAFKLARDFEQQKKPEEALAVLNLCYQHTADNNLDLKTSEHNAPDINTFTNEVLSVKTRVPPGYHEKFSTQIDPELSVDIEQLKLALELQLQLLQKKNSSIVITRHKEICDSLRKERTKIDAAMLFQIVRAALETDYQVAVGEMGVDYALIFAANRNFQSFLPVARLFLWPTVFDEESALSSASLVLAGARQNSKETDDDDDDDDDDDNGASSKPPTNPNQRRNSVSSVNSVGTAGDNSIQRKFLLSQLLKKHEIVVDQLRFLRAFTEITWKGGLDVTKKLIDLMSKEKLPKPFPLSFSTNAAFMHALLRDNYYREFFQFVDELIQNTQGYPNQTTFKAFAAVGARDFEKFLKEKMVPIPKRPWETDHLQKALDAILFLTKNNTLCPESAFNLFGPALAFAILSLFLFSHFSKHSKIALAFEKALKELIKNPDPSLQLSGAAQAKPLAESIKKQITAFQNDTSLALNKSSQFVSLQNGLSTIISTLDPFISN